MSDKTTKDAVEHFGGVWPDNCDFITVYKGNFHKHNYYYDQPIGAFVGVHYDKGTETIDKQQFEDYVRENMGKQKYKYVNAGIKTVGEFIDSVISGKEIYKSDLDDAHFFVYDGKIMLYSSVWDIDAIQSELGTFRVRQPLPWYEVEGVFDTPKLVEYHKSIYLIDGMKGNTLKIKGEDGQLHRDYCTPLTPTEAAKCGVE